MRNNLATSALHEAKTFVTNTGSLILLPLSVELFHLGHNQTQDIGVQAATKAFVRSDQNDTTRFHLIPFAQEWMLVLG